MTIIDDIYVRKYGRYKWNKNKVAIFDEINTFYIYCFKNRLKTIIDTKERWQCFNSCVLSNAFVNQNTKDECIAFFGSYIRVLIMIFRLIHKIHNKRAKKNVNSMDLLGNDFRIMKPNYILYLRENGVFYKFSLNDIKRTIQESLSYSNDYLIITPLHPKNPYTNLKFTNMSLYKIYIWLRSNNIYSRLFETYVKHNFQLDDVFYYNSYYLQKQKTIDYLKNEISQQNKFLKLIEVIYIFASYIPNDYLISQYFIDIHNKHTKESKSNLELELLSYGLNVLHVYFFYILFEINIEFCDNKKIKNFILKSIPLDKYFVKVKCTFQERKNKVVNGTFMDYIKQFVKTPFQRRRLLSFTRYRARRNRTMIENINTIDANINEDDVNEIINEETNEFSEDSI